MTAALAIAAFPLLTLLLMALSRAERSLDHGDEPARRR